MSRKKECHQNFLAYMKKIVEHTNYKGLPIKKRSDGSYAWIASKKTNIGQQRINWCKNKAKELLCISKDDTNPGVYAEVMLKIHPTKYKACQICGKEMSLYYHYPNANFLKSLNKRFNSKFSDTIHISDIWDELINNGIDENDISTFLIKTCKLSSDSKKATKDEIIEDIEDICRKKGKKFLGPGAMSNFPDRYDGFHSYNRCCRSTEDKGRTKENLKSYTNDRRAYEYWSGGNIHAANQFMGSKFFNDTSADHIGPISLGFIHDPNYLKPMPSSDNSAKRNRLQLIDIKKMIEIEQKTKICAISWQSKLIWGHIKSNYINNQNKIETEYQQALLKNMSNFMFILSNILNSCPKNGEKFLTEAFLSPNYEYFKYDYEFNSEGEIINKKNRRLTDNNKNELDRYKKVAIDSIKNYFNKKNRNNTNNLSENELKILESICITLESKYNLEKSKKILNNLFIKIQKRIINTL